jgi:hypothetical protein
MAVLVRRQSVCDRLVKKEVQSKQTLQLWEGFCIVICRILRHIIVDLFFLSFMDYACWSNHVNDLRF